MGSGIEWGPLLAAMGKGATTALPYASAGMGVASGMTSNPKAKQALALGALASGLGSMLFGGSGTTPTSEIAGSFDTENRLWGEMANKIKEETITSPPSAQESSAAGSMPQYSFDDDQRRRLRQLGLA